MSLAKKLMYKAMNNEAKYEAYIFGLEALLAIGVKSVELFEDSSLVVYQVRGEWLVKK